MLNVKVFTDGSCLGNPGVGGYCGIMQCNGKERIVAGCCTEMTTNNRMELKAVLEVVDWLNRVQKEPCEIEVYTDSQYIVNCHTHERKWLTSESRPNHDIWHELIQKGLAGKHHITFVKVSGHKGVELNERCDKIAKAQALKARHLVYGG
ncbi:MAG: hypothetical protein J6Y78_15615 [Paludibacteraceae bacterium]|nr:hypothetical protein [Paludibacteraceae bacterium]